MNLYPLRWLSKTRGPAFTMLAGLQQNGCFRFSRIDGVCSELKARRLVVGIGQMHPVLHGRFAGFQAKQIAAAQAAIFAMCQMLKDICGVRTFGQEGFSSPDGSHIEARLSDETLVNIRHDALRIERAPMFMRKTARLWRKALDRGDRPEAEKQSIRLNGLSLLQAFDPGTTVFPIEDRDIHSAVGDTINQLHLAITNIEATQAFISAREKGGKNLTQEEYNAVVKRNALLKAFSKTLRSPERDKAIFRAVLDVSEAERQHDPEATKPIVFVLGQAHKRAFLRLAKEYLPNDTLFLWITPSPLLFMVRVKRVFVAVVVVAAVVGYGWWV